MKQLRNPKLLAAGGAIIVIGIVWAIVGLVTHTAHPKTASSSAKPPTTAVIEITPSGFLPQTIAVNPNTQVVWVNEDVMPHLPAADPYPSHKQLPQLVAPRALGQKETYSFTFTKAGTIHYHDDLEPTVVGVVEVR